MTAATTRFVSPRSPDAVRLLAALTAELAALYADRGDTGGAGFRPEDVEGPRAGFVVALVDDVAVGCGAIRPYDEESAEVKRMFVAPEYRGRGIAGLVLAALESEAARLGYRRILLETGDRQPEAVRVYERAGYRRIPPYGIYVGWVGSLCFEKALPSASPASARSPRVSAPSS